MVGMAQQGVGVSVVHRKQGDANTGRSQQPVPVHLHGLCHLSQQALERAVTFFRLLQALHQHHEFIAAQAGNGVIIAQYAFDALGDFHQIPIADGMAQLIVDGFEAVQVQIAQGKQGVFAAAAGDGQPHAVGQQGAVGDTRHRIEIGQIFQFPLMLLDLTDVGKHRNVMRNLTGHIEHRRDVQPFRVNFAILSAIPDLAMPIAKLAQARPQTGIKLSIMLPGLQNSGIAAYSLLTAITRGFTKRLVDVQNEAIRIGNSDPLLGISEYAGPQSQAFLGLFLFANIVQQPKSPGKLTFGIEVRSGTDTAPAHGTIRAPPAQFVMPRMSERPLRLFLLKAQQFGLIRPNEILHRPPQQLGFAIA